MMVFGLGVSLGKVTAAEDTAVEFFRGKTVAVRTQSPGGTTDMMVRVIAPYLEKELGATVVVVPSRGNIRQTNTLFSARPDGLTIGITDASSVRLPEFFDEPGVKYETAKFEWIASFGAMPDIFFVSPKKPYKSIADLKKAKGLKFVVSTPGGNYDAVSMLVIDVLGLDAKVTTGLSVSEIFLMMQKGEADASTVTDVAAAPQVEKGKVLPLFSVVGKSKMNTFAGLPNLGELVTMTPKQKLIEKVVGTYKFVIAPPNTPADRVNYLRRVFKNIVENEKATAAMKNLGLVDWNYVPGEEAYKILLEQQQQAREVKAELKSFIQKYRMKF